MKRIEHIMPPFRRSEHLINAQPGNVGGVHPFRILVLPVPD
jgi:hypothetical protein